VKTVAPLIALGGAALFGIAALSGPAAAERAVAIPVAKVDVPPAPGLQTAVFAGGCFWGVEAVFEQVKGVREVVSGYAGGTRDTATYNRVSSERTRHAEAVRVTYYPHMVSYGTLLRVFFSIAHDPTQLNRQGPDVGTSYRSAVFPQTPDQVKVAKAYISQLGAARAYPRPIVTRVESGAFFPAEAYHQDFARRNPGHPYIVRWDAPKVAGFRAGFPALAR
jgi:peptide-methionine (S)-S-oxide reductase